MIEVLVLAICNERESVQWILKNCSWHRFFFLLHVLMLRSKLWVVVTDRPGPLRSIVCDIFHVLFILMEVFFSKFGWSLPTSLGQSGGLVYFVSFSCLQYYCLRGFNTRNRQDVFVFGFLCFFLFLFAFSVDETMLATQWPRVKQFTAQH